MRTAGLAICVYAFLLICGRAWMIGWDFGQWATRPLVDVAVTPSNTFPDTRSFDGGTVIAGATMAGMVLSVYSSHSTDLTGAIRIAVIK